MGAGHSYAGITDEELQVYEVEEIDYFIYKCTDSVIHDDVALYRRHHINDRICGLFIAKSIAR